jgi:hypothetical protein
MYHAGIHAGSKILVFPKASSEEIAKLQAVPDQRIRGFDDELLSVMRRRQNERSSTLPSGVSEMAICVLAHEYVYFVSSTVR